jgi:hypothetical protein
LPTRRRSASLSALLVAAQTNPGGYKIVAYLGLAAPVRSPQIGAPERP